MHDSTRSPTSQIRFIRIQDGDEYESGAKVDEEDDDADLRDYNESFKTEKKYEEEEDINSHFTPSPSSSSNHSRHSI